MLIVFVIVERIHPHALLKWTLDVVGEGILKMSSLGCVLSYWKKINGSSCGIAQKDDLIKYCKSVVATV